MKGVSVNFLMKRSGVKSWGYLLACETKKKEAMCLTL